MSDILELLAQANPVPNELPLTHPSASSDRRLVPIENRRQSMQTITREEPRTTSRLVPALVGVVAVLATIGIVFATGDGGGEVPFASSPDRQIADVPETPPTVDVVPLVDATPVEVVETYLDRLNVGDLSGALALHSEDYRNRSWPGLSGDGIGPGDLVAKWSLYFVALRGQLVHDCSEISDGRVRCSVTAIDDLSRSMGVPGMEYEWTIEVVDGLIDRGLLLPGISVSGQPDYGQTEYGAAIADFERWARNNYEDEYLAACREQGLFSSWSLDCARFSLRYVDRYVSDMS